MIKRDPIPEKPTREQELEYLHFLQNSFANQKILTIHPRYSMACPDRLGFLQKKKLQGEYYKSLLINFAIINIVGFPVIA